MNFHIQTFIFHVVLVLHAVFFIEVQGLDSGNTSPRRGNGEVSSDVENLCRMASHQSAVINNTLYLMGGNVVYGSDRSFKDRDSQIAAPNTYLRTIDLTQDFNLTLGFRHTRRYDIPKGVPSISKGNLWIDDDRLLLVGGLTERVNESYPNYTNPTENYDVWRYDLSEDSDNIWRILPIGRSDGILRAFDAAGIYVKQVRKGFLLGGTLSHDSQSSIPKSVGNREVGGLLVWDGMTESWDNKSTPWSGRGRHSTRGFYLPYGKQGVLIFFGGLAGDETSGDDNLTFPMNRVDMYDIKEDKWYSQEATGTIPSHRTNFCGQAVSSPDNSTHQIYIFGGAKANSELSADVYVLTIPTFKWQAAIIGDSNRVDTTSREPRPREYATCDLVSGGSSMMIYGGKISEDITPTICDLVGNVYLFNLNDWRWKSTYLSKPKLYEVPQPIWSTFPHGNDTSRLGPDKGFEEPHIADIMGNGPVTWGSNKSTTAEPPHDANTSNHTITSNTIVLAVAIVSGILGAISLIGGFYWYRRRSRGRSPSSPHPKNSPEYDGVPEIDGNPIVPFPYELPVRHSDSQQYQLGYSHPHELPAARYSGLQQYQAGTHELATERYLNLQQHQSQDMGPQELPAVRYSGSQQFESDLQELPAVRYSGSQQYQSPHELSAVRYSGSQQLHEPQPQLQQLYQPSLQKSPEVKYSGSRKPERPSRQELPTVKYSGSRKQYQASPQELLSVKYSGSQQHYQSDVQGPAEMPTPPILRHIIAAPPPAHYHDDGYYGNVPILYLDDAPPKSFQKIVS